MSIKNSFVLSDKKAKVIFNTVFNFTRFRGRINRLRNMHLLWIFFKEHKFNLSKSTIDEFRITKMNSELKHSKQEITQENP